MHRWHRTFLAPSWLALACAASLAWPGVLAAQGSPRPPSAPPDLGVTDLAGPDVATMDLAAMALAPQDVPAGFHDEYSEWLVPRAAMADLFGVEPPMGLERLYQSFYLPNYDVQPGDALVHVFLFKFDSAESAAAGASVVEAVLRPPLPPGETIGPERLPGPEVGEDPRTTTRVTYDTRAEGGPMIRVTAASFRRGPIVAGVSIERTLATDGDAAASPPIQPSAGPDADDAALAGQLAATLDGRIEDVLAGGSPAGVTRLLSERMLPIERLAGGPVPVLGGYKAAIDLLRCGPCGEESPLAEHGDAALDGYARSVVVGPMVDGEPQPPFVAVGMVRFPSASDAQAALEAIRTEPNDLPTSGPFPRGRRALADAPSIPGASDALAFHAVTGEEADALPDGAGVDLVVDDLLVTIDVLGGLTGDAAMDAALDLASQQVACLAADAACADIVVPGSLAEAAAGS